MAKKQSKKKALKGAKIARQKALPGMEDRKIERLENAALKYAEVRDARMELSKEEVKYKTKVAEIMHAEGKKEYKHGNVSIVLIPEGEKVKVRVKAEGEEPSPDAPVTDEEIAAHEEVTEVTEGDEPEEFEEESEEE